MKNAYNILSQNMIYSHSGAVVFITLRMRTKLSAFKVYLRSNSIFIAFSPCEFSTQKFYLSLYISSEGSAYHLQIIIRLRGGRVGGCGRLWTAQSATCINCNSGEEPSSCKAYAFGIPCFFNGAI
jgi:hypothetical protein